MMVPASSLIPKLCNKHLLLSWRNAWKIRKITRNPGKTAYAPGILEFIQCPLHLDFRLYLIREELLARKFNPNKTIDPFDNNIAPFTQYFKERKLYKPSFSLDQQIEYLRKARCKCRI